MPSDIIAKNEQDLKDFVQKDINVPLPLDKP
jgi:hypothetical protein